MRFQRGLASFATLLLLTCYSRADEVNLAREHFKKGTTAYDLGRYVEAASEYEKAYELKNDPALLFNIGQAYRNARQYARAITAYRSYLRNVPDANNRIDVEARVTEMQRQLVEQQKTAEDPPRGTLPAEPLKNPPALTAPAPSMRFERAVVKSNGRAKKIAGFAVGGAGIVLLALGGALVVLARDANMEITSTGTFNAGAQDRRDAYQAADVACFAIGGTALAGGVVLYLVGRSRDRF